MRFRYSPIVTGCWVLALAVPLTLVSCVRESRVDHQKVPSTNAPDYRPGSPSEDDDDEEAEYRGGKSSDVLKNFYVTVDNEVRSKVQNAQSVACLPLVTYGPGLPRDGKVTELGVEIAKELAGRIGRQRLDAAGPTEIAMLVEEMNGTRASLAQTAEIRKHAVRLGFDVVVCGIINVRDDRARWGPDAEKRLEVKATAFDVVTAKVICEEDAKITNKKMRYREYWDLHAQESSWQPGSRWGPPTRQPSYSAEIRTAGKVLGQKVSRILNNKLAAGGINGSVYFPPTDTSTFVVSVARLRTAQSIYAREIERRTQSAATAGTPLDTTTGMTILETEFETLQQAEAYLDALRESLAASAADGGRYAQNISSNLASEMQPTLARAGVGVVDRNFHPGTSGGRHLVEGELATGGLVRDSAARKTLQEGGVAMVVAPRLEQYGAEYILRVEIYDLAENAIVGSAFFPLDTRFTSDIQKDLGVEGYDMRRIADVQTAEKNTWNQIYEDSKSGVVKLVGPNGLGSGFVVSPEGHIITNSHVINGIGTGAQVILRNGKKQSFQVLENDAYWDIAVLQVASLPKDTHIFEFAPAEKARVGVDVAVLGHPKGSDGWILTPGYLSSVSEEVDSSAGNDRPSYMYTSPTRGGSSGSPVLLRDGRVIAVHAAGQLGYITGGAQASELVGFALGVPGVETKKLLDGALN